MFILFTATEKEEVLEAEALATETASAIHRPEMVSSVFIMYKNVYIMVYMVKVTHLEYLSVI